MSLPRIEIPKHVVKERRRGITTTELPELTPELERPKTQRDFVDPTKEEQLEKQILKLQSRISELDTDKKSLTQDIAKAKRRRDDKLVEKLKKRRDTKEKQITKEKDRVSVRKERIAKSINIAKRKEAKRRTQITIDAFTKPRKFQKKGTNKKLSRNVRF